MARDKNTNNRLHSYHARLTRFRAVAVARHARGARRGPHRVPVLPARVPAARVVPGGEALREAFMLTKFSAETRAYAVALMALVLMLCRAALRPAARHHLDGAHLLRLVTIFFVTTLPLFAVLAHYQVPIAFAFFIWVGIYGVMVVSQMWPTRQTRSTSGAGQRAVCR